MFRRLGATAKGPRRFPHARGDVPVSIPIVPAAASFSPRAWGCSFEPFDPTYPPAVFPTRVGMFRASSICCAAQYGFPHARGDVPIRARNEALDCRFSPRAWGCSGVLPDHHSLSPVFPTRVGMFRMWNLP